MRRYGRMAEISDDQFAKIVENSISESDVLRGCGYSMGAGGHDVIKRRILQQQLNTDHFLGQAHNRGKTFTRKPLGYYLVKDCPTRIMTDALKKRMLREGYKKYVCEQCGISEWQGKLAPLHLHHIDGDRTNNSAENLQILCANCHAQTDNYAGNAHRENNQRENRAPVLCACGKPMGKESSCCRSCSSKRNVNRFTKIQWPSLDELLAMHETMSYAKMGRQLNVTKTTIRMHIRTQQKHL